MRPYGGSQKGGGGTNWSVWAIIAFLFLMLAFTAVLDPLAMQGYGIKAVSLALIPELAACASLITVFLIREKWPLFLVLVVSLLFSTALFFVCLYAVGALVGPK